MRSATRSAATDAAPLAAFVDTVQRLAQRRVSTRPRSDAARLARVAEVWDKVNRAARDVEIYNLDRKPLVFQRVRLLAEAAR